MRHVACVEEKQTAYRALLGTSSVKRLFERNRLRWKDSDETDIKVIRMRWCELDQSGSGGSFWT